MQPYFDPTRKTTSKKMEDDLKKNENGRRPQFFFEKLEWRTQTKMEEDFFLNGRWPKKNKKMGNNQQKKIKKEDDLKKNQKMEDDIKENGRRTNQPKST